MVGNLAALAKVTASSSEPGHAAESAVDGLLGGYPANPEQEWAADKVAVGASLKLAWNTPQKVSRLVLYDRPNRVDQVTGATIRFSDGSRIEIEGELENSGNEPYVVTFRQGKSLRLPLR